MAIPDLDDDGLLPAGLHDCSFEELRERFGRFRSSDHRERLAEALRAYLAELRAAGVAAYVVVDGSFVTAKEKPGDIDLFLALRADLDLAADLLPRDYNAISKRSVRRRYPFDLLVAPEGSDACQHQIEFFEQVKGRPDLRKGLLRIVP